MLAIYFLLNLFVKISAQQTIHVVMQNPKTIIAFNITLLDEVKTDMPIPVNGQISKDVWVNNYSAIWAISVTNPQLL